MSDEDFAAWLRNRAVPRIVLIEVTAAIEGEDTTLYLATGAYTTGGADTPAHTPYLPIVSNGFRYTEKISLTNEASLLAGDIELSNHDGSIDPWLDYVWRNQPMQAWIGDPSWPRADFRLIFNGIVDDIDSRSRDVLNLKIRDKLQRLNTPMSEEVLGGSTPNANAIIPLCFGECHNVTPLLTDPTTLEYQVHNGPIERIIEVRDNGKPIANDDIGWDAVTAHLSTGKFNLEFNPAGAVTVSVQGDKHGGVYRNTIATLVERIVTGYGKATDQFDAGDLDSDNLDDFDAANPQPVGIYLANRENVLSVCRKLTASVGAQIVMSRAGELRIFQIALPAPGAATAIGPDQMLLQSLQIVERPAVVAAVKIAYCKNWTMQPGLQTTIPAEHKDLFNTEWLTKTATDSAVKAAYRLNEVPQQVETMLMVGSDAAAEAARALDLGKVQRTVFQFQGMPECLLLELAGAVELTSSRFNLAAGVDGMVVSLAPDWVTGNCTVGVFT